MPFAAAKSATEPSDAGANSQVHSAATSPEGERGYPAGYQPRVDILEAQAEDVEATTGETESTIPQVDAELAADAAPGAEEEELPVAEATYTHDNTVRPPVRFPPMAIPTHGYTVPGAIHRHPGGPIGPQQQKKRRKENPNEGE